jgi:pimeloyl-ACP methyl ester carboxylesterase
MGLAHIDALLDYMEAHYAFDPADINLVGVSDGSLGVIVYSAQGRRRLHRRVLISSAPQLVLPVEALPGQPRFADGRWDFLQGGRDRLFPADEVVPYLQRWEKLYPNAHLHYFPDGEHDFSFYAEKASGLLTGLLAAPVSNPAVTPEKPAEGPRKPADGPGKPK